MMQVGTILQYVKDIYFNTYVVTELLSACKNAMYVFGNVIHKNFSINTDVLVSINDYSELV